MHVPVMPEETLDLLAVRPEGVYLDCTTGMGGHTGLIAQRLTTGTVIANDRDAESLRMAAEKTAEWKARICFHLGRFGSLPQAVEQAGFEKVDGLLADTGVSRYQLTSAHRGFSFMADGPLDMRMEQSGGRTAADLVNHTDEKTLADLIFQLGEERRARRIARAIVRARPLRSTLHLADVVERAVPRTGRLHPATKTFMALRMAVNDESGELGKLLEVGPELVRSGGRMVVISFASGDDRQVKERFRSLARDGRARLLTKHPLEPGDLEVDRNPAARSAKLRAIEMV
ncbi:MAG: 16S rRNA (cytosine(1402)-N(4))-methyltransferase RsmH [Acidobacteria bacterium]|nr:16S rRNA (cytosine(1402)-N(4))-methyltransferase RsmH [Acidobacteriota bacterium]